MACTYTSMYIAKDDGHYKEANDPSRIQRIFKFQIWGLAFCNIVVLLVLICVCRYKEYFHFEYGYGLWVIDYDWEDSHNFANKQTKSFSVVINKILSCFKIIDCFVFCMCILGNLCCHLCCLNFHRPSFNIKNTEMAILTSTAFSIRQSSD